MIQNDKKIESTAKWRQNNTKYIAQFSWCRREIKSVKRNIERHTEWKAENHSKQHTEGIRVRMGRLRRENRGAKLEKFRNGEHGYVRKERI